MGGGGAKRFSNVSSRKVKSALFLILAPFEEWRREHYSTEALNREGAFFNQFFLS